MHDYTLRPSPLSNRRSHRFSSPCVVKDTCCWRIRLSQSHAAFPCFLVPWCFALIPGGSALLFPWAIPRMPLCPASNILNTQRESGKPMTSEGPEGIQTQTHIQESMNACSIHLTLLMKPEECFTWAINGVMRAPTRAIPLPVPIPIALVAVGKTWGGKHKKKGNCNFNENSTGIDWSTLSHFVRKPHLRCINICNLPAPCYTGSSNENKDCENCPGNCKVKDKQVMSFTVAKINI